MTDTPSPLPGYLTAQQAAAAWGVAHSTVRKWLRDGHVPGAVKLGRDWLIPAGTPRPPNRPEGAAAHRKHRQADTD